MSEPKEATRASALPWLLGQTGEQKSRYLASVLVAVLGVASRVARYLCRFRRRTQTGCWVEAVRFLGKDCCAVHFLVMAPFRIVGTLNLAGALMFAGLFFLI